MLYKEDPDYNRIVNLYLITFLISKWSDNPVFVNDPNYIKEKWMRFIGFYPRRYFLPGSREDYDYKTYVRKWGLTNNFHPIVMYLASEHQLKFDKMIENFERYIGPFEMINPNPAGGLHPNSMAAIPKILEQNSNKIKEVLRPRIIDRING